MPLRRIFRRKKDVCIVCGKANTQNKGILLMNMKTNKWKHLGCSEERKENHG